MVQLCHIGRGLGPISAGGTASSGPPAWVLSGASLDIDFANNRAWSQSTGVVTPDTLMTITRASSGMALSSGGVWTSYGNNLLRLSDLGVNVEIARTCILLQNTDLTNAAWVAASLTVTAGQAAPDGTTNAVTISDDAASSTHNLSNNNALISFNNGTTYTLMVRAKAGTSGLLQLTFSTSRFTGLGYVNFDLNAGTIAGFGGTMVSRGILSEGNGVYLCYITATCNSGGTGTINMARINAGTDGRFPTYVGNAQTVLIWNPQVYAGTFPGSPIYTAGSSVQRAADNIQLGATAAALAQAAKSSYAETRKLLGGAAPRILDFGSTASLQASQGPTGTTVATQGSGSTATATIGGSGNTYGLVKAAFSHDGTTNKAIANGGVQATAAGAWGVTTETPQVGNLAALTAALNGHLGRLAFSNVAGNFDGLTV